MKKTLFIQIDNTPIPKGTESDYVTLDCRQTNDFCSFAGDVLCGEMKDPEGTPYYKIVKPAGKLISEFEQTNQESFQTIINSWQELLAHLIQDCNLPSVMFFTFPQEYTNWLQESSSEYYRNIGYELQSCDNVAKISTEDIYETIIFRKISKNILEKLNQGSIDFLVFSNPYVNSEVSVINNLAIDVNGTHFVTYDQLEDWGKLIEERRARLMTNLTYDKFLSQNESFVNQQIERTFDKVMKGLEYIQGYAFFANFSLWKRDKIGSLFEDEDFRQTFYECENKMAGNLSEKVQGFREENEYNLYNEYEDKICKTLGIENITTPKSRFMDYQYPIEYPTAIRNFINIIIDFNEANANEDLGIGFAISSVSSFVNNESNDYIDNLRGRLQHYYKYYCLGNLKESLQRIWSIYEPRVEKEKSENKSSGCYVTTSMCKYLRKRDDCYELTILRGFRDNWLCYQPNGKDLIKEYYRYAPSIVDKLNLAPDKDIIYGQIKKCIYTCLAYIWSNQFEKAKSMYIFMIRLLSNKFKLSNGR